MAAGELIQNDLEERGFLSMTWDAELGMWKGVGVGVWFQDETW